MTDLEIFLVGVVVLMLIVLVILSAFAMNFKRKAQTYFANWQTRQTGAYTLGTHQVMGDLSQVLGTFSFLSNYEQIILLSTTSAQSSMDLLGIKGDCLEFIELKKKGGALAKAERKIKRLVDQGKVKYVIKDVELPDTVRISERSGP